MDSLASMLSSSFKNITKAWQQQVHLSQAVSDHIDNILTRVQWTQNNLAKELANQQTFRDLHDTFRLKVQINYRN